LKFLLTGEKLVRKRWAKLNNYSPSTVKDALDRLVSKGLVDNPYLGMWLITDMGKRVVNESNVGVEGRQEVYRGRDSFSLHRLQFLFKEKTRSFYDPDSLDKLGSKLKTVYLHNWSYERVKIDDSELRIYPTKIMLLMSEVTCSDVESGLMIAFEKALNIASSLKSIGLIIEGVSLNKSEFALLEPVFNDMLGKKLGKYQYTLDDGTSFWIDFSGGNLESETNNAKLASRFGDVLDDLPFSKSTFSDVDLIQTDVDGLKKVAHMNLMYQVNEIRKMQLLHSDIPKEQTKMGDYFN